jgi:hypothetical protein
VAVAEDELLDLAFQVVTCSAWSVVGNVGHVGSPPNLKHLLAELLIHLETLGDGHLEQAEQDGEDAT